MKYQKRFRILLSVAVVTSSTLVPITNTYAFGGNVALVNMPSKAYTLKGVTTSASIKLEVEKEGLGEVTTSSAIELLLVQSMDSIDYKAKLRESESKIKLLKDNEVLKAFYQKEVVDIRAYREILGEYTTLLREAVSDVEVVYNGGRLDHIQAKMKQIKNGVQEHSPLDRIIEERVQEIEEIKVLCINIRQALAALQLKDIDNGNAVTKTGYPYSEILETDKSNIYPAITKLEGKNGDLRKVVDGFLNELGNVKIVKFEAERDALEKQKGNAEKFINTNRGCKVESLKELEKALDFAKSAPNQDQRSVLIYHTENLEKWYQKASIECKAEKVITENKDISLESLNKLSQGLRESIENKDLSKEKLKYFTDKLNALVLDAEVDIHRLGKSQPKAEVVQPKVEVAKPKVSKKSSVVSGGGSGSTQTQKTEKEKVKKEKTTPVEAKTILVKEKVEPVSTHIEIKDIIAKNDVEKVMSNLKDLSTSEVNYDAIKKVVSKGLMQGYGDNKFKPEKEITRAEAAQVLAKLITEPVQKDVKALKDVASNKWFHDAVQKCVSAKIMVGYTDNSFKPNGTITKTEILIAVSNLQKVEPLDKEATDKVLAKYKDKENVPAWARGYIAALIDKGIIQELNDTLNVTAPLTREQMAGILSQIIK